MPTIAYRVPEHHGFDHHGVASSHRNDCPATEHAHRTGNDAVSTVNDAGRLLPAWLRAVFRLLRY
jgi:hypothetical protein